MLGGIINPAISDQRGDISLGEASERLIAAVELYRRYPSTRIVFSGGNASVIFRGPSESEYAGRVLEPIREV